MIWNIYESKIKYELLDNMLKDELNNILFSSNVNIIIDLKQIYRKIFRNSVQLDDIDERMFSIESERIVSEIIGIISHYRNYFYKRKKYTKFYFLYSEKECEYFKNIYSDYKKDYYSKYFDIDNPNYKKKIELIKRCNKALKILINIIPNCLYIETSDFDELVYCKALINSIPTNEINLILTNDDLMLQMVSNNTVYLNLHGTASDIVKPQSIYNVLLDADTLKNDLSNNLVNLVLSIAGSKKYSIEGIKKIGVNRAYDIVKDLVQNNIINNTRYIVFPLTPEVLEGYKNSKYYILLYQNLEKIQENFNLITVDRIASENKILLERKFTFPNKIYSYNAFLDLNANTFTNFPLAIDMLLKGEVI